MGTLLERELGIGSDLLASATARAAALARASERCRAVLAPSSVRERPDAVVAVRMPVAPGASLAEVRGSRALTIGECVLIGVGVADALAAMHAERLAHGDVSAANVMVSGRRVSLVDTMGALCEERGTPGYVAPERTQGATPAGDVYSLGALLRALADAKAAPIIEAWTAPLLATDPEVRPSATHAAAALARCAPPEAVRAPDAPVAAAMRACAVERTVRRPEDRWWHAQKASLRLSPLACLVALAVLTGVALVPSLRALPTPLERPLNDNGTQATIPVSAAAFDQPDVAAMDLAKRRIQALADGDAAALLAVSAPGAAAALADADIAAALDDGSLRFADLTLETVAAHVVMTKPGGAIVKVSTTLGPYRDGEGEHEAGTATATLDLVLTQRGWLVARILPPP